MKHVILALGLSLACATTVWAQETNQHQHGTHQEGQAPGGTTAGSPADTAYRAALAKMHKDMDIPLTGNPDLDFVRGMIAHHQGAIDMARVVLDHGKDPEVKALAQAIIAAQEAEIDWMKKWLAENGG